MLPDIFLLIFLTWHSVCDRQAIGTANDAALQTSDCKVLNIIILIIINFKIRKKPKLKFYFLITKK